MRLQDALKTASDDVKALNPDVFAPSVAQAESEQAMQVRLLEMLEPYCDQYPELRFLHHSPNGGLRSKAVAGKLKAMGTKAGHPDLALDVPRGSYHGLFIELKQPGGRLSDAQRRWLTFLEKHQYRTAVCFGAEEALQVILAYLDGE